MRKEGGDYIIYSCDIPQQYQLMALGISTAHIVHETEFAEEDFPSAICGLEVDTTKSSVRLKGICTDCLEKMNGIMKELLYDKHNEEYYHPKEQ